MCVYVCARVLVGGRGEVSWTYFATTCLNAASRSVQGDSLGQVRVFGKSCPLFFNVLEYSGVGLGKVV